MQAKLRIYPETLSFELQHSLNYVNGFGNVEEDPLKFLQWGPGW